MISTESLFKELEKIDGIEDVSIFPDKTHKIAFNKYSLEGDPEYSYLFKIGNYDSNNVFQTEKSLKVFVFSDEINLDIIHNKNGSTDFVVNIEETNSKSDIFYLNEGIRKICEAAYNSVKKQA
jgi:hypothetical protein